MKKLNLLLSLIILFSSSISQAQLVAGDIAFIGMNADAPEGYSFITLTDIAGSDVIFFSDRGIISTAAYIGGDEGTYRFTAPPAGIPCGTIVSFDELVANVYTITGVSGATMTQLTGDANFGTADQIYAYQTAGDVISTVPSDATFIAGVQGEYAASCVDPVTKWTQAVCVSSTSESIVPPGLTNGFNCVSVTPAGPEKDNLRYNGTLTGTSTALLAAINNFTNWETTDAGSYDIKPSGYAATSVTCVAPCTDPDIPTATSAPGIICDGNAALLTISGDKNDATAWHVYTGSCGGTLVGTTAGSTIIVVPTPPSTEYFIRGEGGCVTPGSCGSITVTTTAREDASFSYTAAAYCQDDANPTPTITGVGGGTFSAGGGLVINTSTGMIDVSASTPAAYTVTYNTPGLCDGDEDRIVTINALDDASFSYDAAAYCIDDSDPTPSVTGLGGGTFSSGGGLSLNATTGAIDVSISTAGTYTVTYTTAGTCPNTSSVTVTVNNLDDPSFSYDPATYCADDSDPSPTITGLAGGSFSAGPGLSINASTGDIDVSVSTPGTYTVTYTTSGTCPNASSVSVTVNGLDDASFSYDAATYCVDDSDPTPTITGLAGGTFSAGVGLSINASTGAIDVSTSTPGSYTVTYTTNGTCPNASSVSVTINTIDDPSFSYDAAAYCADDSDPSPTITGLAGGTFSAGVGLSINASTGAIDVSASTPGTYTITYTTAGSCPNASSVSVTVNALDDASFTYDDAAYCVDDSDPTPTITGLAGGTFSAGVGLSINASTGAIDVSTSTPGSYTVTYTTSGTCPNASSVSVTINAIDDPSFSYDAAAYCADDSDPTPTITGLAGGTFSAGVGLSINTSTGAIDVSASTPGTYTITYTTAGSCPNASSVSVTVNALDDASFSYDAAAYCVDDSDPTPTITGLAGGTFSAGVGLSINASTGAVDVSTSTPGTYTVTYTTNGTCPNASSVSVTINALDDASFSYDAAAYCASDSDPSPTITGLAGGTFSAGVGLSINASTGAIDVSASTPGTYTITYTTAGSCPNASSVSVTVNALDDASFSYDSPSYCISEADPTPTITGLAGGTFTAGAGLIINAATGELDVSASTPGSYTITYTTTGTCPNTSSVAMAINTLDDASFNYDDAVYCPNGTDPTPTITGVSGGTFSSDVGLSINATTGEIDLSASTEGTYTVTYTTIGLCANSTTETVTVLDDTVPVPDIADLPDVTAECEVTSLTDPTASDNCGGVITVTNDASLPITDQGTTEVTWTYEDENGNTTTQTQDVVINDVTPPVPDITDLADVTAECEVTSLTDPTATDNCGGIVTASSDAVLPITDQGTTTITWTYDDVNGNSITQTQDIVIDDISGPTPDIADLDDITAECEVTSLTDPTATDNCDGPVTISNDAVLPFTDQGTTEITWTYEDENGNISTQTQDVVIDDITPPTILDCPIDIAAIANMIDCSADVFWTEPTFTDNCIGATMTSTHSPGDIFSSGTTTVTYTATDIGGNESICSFDITVNSDLAITTDIIGEIFGADGAIDVTVTGGSEPYLYDWDIDGMGDFDDAEDLTGLVAGFYTLEVIDDFGCTITEIIEVVLECLPLTTDVSDFTICENEFLTLDATSESGADITWDLGVINGVPFIPGMTGTITYTATSAEDEDCPFSVDIEVLAAPEVIASAGDGSFCDGETVVLAASGDADNFSWDPTDFDPPIGVTTYTLTGVYDESGCMNTSTIDITVHALPTVVANAENETVCVNNEITLFGSGALTYEWLGGVIDNESFIEDLAGTNSYVVTGTDENGCINTDEITIVIASEITITSVITDEFGGAEGAINITVTGGLAPYEFDWNNDIIGDFDDDEDLTGLPYGFYEVIVRGEADCEARGLFYVDTQVGIGEEDPETLQLYPNPTQDNLTLQLNGTFDYLIFSLDGKLVLTGQANNQKIIAVGNLEDGTYLIEIRNENGVKRTQFVKN